VRLYLDDIEEIERTLLRLGPNVAASTTGLSVSNGTWEAESVKELVEASGSGGGPSWDFRFESSRRGHFSVNVGRTATSMYVGDMDDMEMRGAAEQIHTILLSARRPLLVRLLVSAFAGGLLYFAVAMVGFVGLTTALVASEDYPTLLGPVSLALLVAGVLSVVVSVRTTLRRNGLAYLVRRESRPSFFKRKGDDLWLVLISAVVGVMVGWVGATLSR
jgi:hypothetical protein